MKSSSLFIISALIFMFTTPSLSSTTTEADDIVYDVDGNPLETGVGYIISAPVWRPLGGSLTLATPFENNKTCEVNVVQHPFDIYYGTSFTFTPVNPDQDVITSSVAVAIQSENSCETSSVWQVSDRGLITTGGIMNTENSCLRITKPPEGFYQYGYMFENCPYMCVGAKICYEIGIYEANGYRHLAAGGGMGVPFVFIKKSKLAPKIDSVSMKTI